MILAKATLVAGPHHDKYAPGTSLPALLFVNVRTSDELDEAVSRELAQLGWATMAIERYKDVTDHGQFEGKDSPEASAFRDALENGFGIVVYP
ncbi:hypothetical protein GCM10027430_36000 [Lysobacter tyrosinilyticus]